MVKVVGSGSKDQVSILGSRVRSGQSVVMLQQGGAQHPLNVLVVAMGGVR